jgi:hypothetical protein
VAAQETLKPGDCCVRSKPNNRASITHDVQAKTVSQEKELKKTNKKLYLKKESVIEKGTLFTNFS